jgi:hypothetical protein
MKRGVIGRDRDREMVFEVGEGQAKPFSGGVIGVAP